MKRINKSRIFFALMSGVLVTWCELHVFYPEWIYKESYIYNRLAEEEDLIEGFASSIYFDDRTQRYDSKLLVRWNRPVLFRLFDDPTETQTDIVQTAATQMERLTGIAVTEAPPGQQEDAVFHIRFAERNKLWRIQVGYGKDEAQARETFERAKCLSVTTYGKGLGNIRFAVNYIADDLAETDLRPCMLEEFIHGFGLGHVVGYRPSILAETGEPQRLSINDMILVRTLYDKRLTAGMSFDQAMPIVKTVIAELVAEVKERGEAALYQ